MGTTSSKQQPVKPPAPVAVATPPQPMPVAPPAPVPAPMPEMEERYPLEEEEEPIPTVDDVIRKLKEANEMLQVIAEAGQGLESPPPPPKQYAGAKKGSKASRSKKQKGGFLDADKAIMNTSGLIQPSNAPSSTSIDLVNTPSTTFSNAGNVVINQLPPMIDSAVYKDITPPLGLQGGAGKKKRARNTSKKI